ncbi:WAP four-disulfide core domain protein 2 [Varanus komodoensis]|nr:WAP four-disulfide core domain protein 2 [Varanus komodoensis]
MKKLHGPLACEATCQVDHDCRGAEKCCETACGRACSLPLEGRREAMPGRSGPAGSAGADGTAPAAGPEKPGKCPRRQRVKTPLEGGCPDTCAHDQECPPGEKCCFTGCSMGCVEAQ